MTTGVIIRGTVLVCVRAQYESRHVSVLQGVQEDSSMSAFPTRLSGRHIGGYVAVSMASAMVSVRSPSMNLWRRSGLIQSQASEDLVPPMLISYR